MANTAEIGRCVKEFGPRYRVPKRVSSIEAMAKTEFDAPEFNRHLFDIQDALDPQGRHDCGGFAGRFFSGMEEDWAEATDEDRMAIIREYIENQIEHIEGEIRTKDIKIGDRIEYHTVNKGVSGVVTKINTDPELKRFVFVTDDGTTAYANSEFVRLATGLEGGDA